MTKNKIAYLTGAGLLVVASAVVFASIIVNKPVALKNAAPAGNEAVSTNGPQSVNVAATDFGSNLKFQEPATQIDAAVSKDFDLSTIQNLDAMEKAYGFTLTDKEKKFLADNKFLEKNLLDTSIRPNSGRDNAKEFVQLYEQLKGPNDAAYRGQQNSIFYTSDVFFNAYNNLYTELLKEMENKTFYPAIKSLTERFYKAADLKYKVSNTQDAKWKKVRNYFAVPYAIFSTAAQPLAMQDYVDAQGTPKDPEKVLADFKTRDAKVDTFDETSKFIDSLNLDAESKVAVLADLKQIYAASDKSVPNVFADEYQAYAQLTTIEFKVDFSQFTPRGTYTSSSLRRQYFRGMKWYIMLPFFIKSPELTSYAFDITQLLAEDQQSLNDYNRLESAINFMVGESDDLMPVDYMKALEAAKGAPDQSQAVLDYLAKAHNPKIKDLAAIYQSVGTENSAEVLLNTKGLRFFSGKFIMDSYWTGFLTQGDEAVRPGYTQKLPPMASSLEVMDLLGSDYAKSQIPKLDFYKASNSAAINQALAELAAEKAKLTEDDWQKNIYTSWLATIESLFDWQKKYHSQLPAFMQSPNWEIKTLQTASVFWTELRHATILYAKQSFAELGGGGDSCGLVPPPPKTYIEPQQAAFARLSFMAKRLDTGLVAQGYGPDAAGNAGLENLRPLESFIDLLDSVQSYVSKELGNVKFNESITTAKITDPNDPEGKLCDAQYVDQGSDWEFLRLQIFSKLLDSLPIPTEGPVLPAKDRRTAIVADVHTGGDSANPTQILYEGEGVPYLILTAVSDANGPRLTIGFTYSHYEFTQPYGGQRKTDEDWQKNFYKGDDPYNAYDYTDKSTWPKPNFWYSPLFDLK